MTTERTICGYRAAGHPCEHETCPEETEHDHDDSTAGVCPVIGCTYGSEDYDRQGPLDCICHLNPGECPVHELPQSAVPGHKVDELAGWYRVQGTDHEWLVTITLLDDFIEGRSSFITGQTVNALTWSLTRGYRENIDAAYRRVRTLCAQDLRGRFVPGAIEERDDRIRFAKGTIRVAEL